MKKVFLLAMLASITNFAMAQDLDDISKLAYLGQTAKAKEGIDKYLAVEKNAKKPEGWYWKAYITNLLSKDSTKSIDESSALKMESFETFKKYRQMDAKATLLEDDHNSQIYDLYAGFASNLAIKAYQDKNPTASFDNFKKASDIHDYSYSSNLVFNGGYKFPELDTLLIQYTAIAGIEAKKPDEAAKYHKKLVDAGLTGDTYADSYNFLVDYYKNKKDKAAFAEILEKAKKLYPANGEYWMALEIEDAVDGIARPAVFAKYDELLAKYSTNYTVAYNYSVELYNYLNGDGAKDANAAALKVKTVEVLKKAIANQSTFDANFLLTNFLYNSSFDIGEESRKIKGNKPEDIKKRKAMEAEATKAMNDALPYGEEALKQFPSIQKPKTGEKQRRKQVLTMIKNIYDTRKNEAKVAEYNKLISEAD
jgi:hypothetical protein